MTTSSLPTTIRALLQPSASSTNVILTTLPLQHPKPNTQEHLIKVHSVSPCAGELLWLSLYPGIMEPSKVNVPCFDFSGTIVTAPANSPFQAGAEVYTRTGGGLTGNAREYTTAVTEELALRPKNLSWEEAAAVPISAFTAWQALFEHGGLAKGWEDEEGRKKNQGKRVLVTAASGGVGTWTVQLARLAGVGEIVALVGPKNVEFIKSLGATEAVNYKETLLGTWAAKNENTVDLVVDMLGGQALTDCWTAVKTKGTLLSVNAPPESRKPEGLKGKDEVKNYFFIMKSRGEELSEITKLIEAGKVKPILDSVYPLEEFEKAFGIVEGGHSRGKVIINILE